MNNYFFAIILIFAIICGGIAGVLWPEAILLKPVGDIFLKLILLSVAPLIFFSITHSIARIPTLRKTGKLFLTMMLVFTFTSVFAAILSIITVTLFPPAKNLLLNLSGNTINNFSIPNFLTIFLQPNFLSLILVSILLGFLSHQIRYKTRLLIFLQLGEKICLKFFSYIMYFAPIGFFAYFATITNEMGTTILQNYLRVAVIYYVFAITYFIFVYSFFAYLAAKKTGLKIFWQNIFLPFVTSVATCSSAASIPANLLAVKNMDVAAEVYETTIPIGAMIHKDGSVIGGIFKIAFLFGVLHLQFNGFSVLSLALVVSLLVGTVMGAIPSGGMLGELLILSVYGFPSSMLMLIAAISIIIDPIATMLNVTGNCVSSMLIQKFIKYKTS